MKKKLILFLITLIASTHCAFAVQEGKVISDSATKKDIQNAFDGINSYTNNFFTPPAKKITQPAEEYRSGLGMLGNDNQSHGTLAPVKKWRLHLIEQEKLKASGGKKSLNKSGESEVTEVAPKDQAILDCDLMQYFAPKTELQADGGVVMFFPENNSTIKADRIIYNQTSNVIKAFGHVVLIKDDKQVFGDYMLVDLNEENSLMDEPVSNVFQVRSHAKKGYLYGDKLIQENGDLLVTKKTMIKMRSEFFGPDLDTMYVPDKDKSFYRKDSHGEVFKIKTNDLIINSKPEHDTITLKHADVYINEKKLATIPSITMHTNKAQDYVEADYPEFGTMMNMGTYIGPGFDFDTPKGTNLKIIPILNYKSGSTPTGSDGGSDSKIGWGAIAKFKSATNKTDFAYGTANEIFIMRGKQRLDDNLWFQYGSNAYMDDWFLGYRMPKLMGELIYEDSRVAPDFLGKNFDAMFTHRVAAGAMQDMGGDPKSLLSSDGAVGTTRFKYMAEAAQTLYKFNTPSVNIYGLPSNPLNARLEIVGQGSAAVYGTGDTQMIARIGPRIHTQYNMWMQDVGYFMSACNDHTPLLYYDRYMYGRSNVYLRESFRLNKYITASWFGSFNLSNDAWDGNMMQENSFFFAIGPDDIKLNIGYDTVREQSFVSMALALDAKGTKIEYKKMVVKNPDTLGKNKNDNKGSQTFAPSAGEEGGAERAEVIDINQQEAL